MTDFHTHTTRRARKPHRCDLCGTTIHPGDHYHHQAGKTDGTFHTWRNCQPCSTVITRTRDYWFDYDHGVDADTATEWATDNPTDPTAAAYLNRLSP